MSAHRKYSDLKHTWRGDKQVIFNDRDLIMLKEALLSLNVNTEEEILHSNLLLRRIQAVHRGSAEAKLESMAKKIAKKTETKFVIALVGPMSGIVDYNYPAFHEAANSLRELGYGVVNPAETPRTDDPDRDWSDYMKKSIRGLLRSDAVGLLEGWRSSRGATIETNLANDLGICLQTVDFWIANASEYVSQKKS